MNESSLQRLSENYQLLASRMPELTRAFYDKLFAVLPEARPLFKKDINVQSQHLAAALALIVRNIRFLDALEQPLMELGVQHARVGVHPEHYPVMCRTMVESLRDNSAGGWSDELEADWSAVL